MHAGVIKLDSLTDTVRAGAKNDHCGLLTLCDLGVGFVRRVMVRSIRLELSCTGVHCLVDRCAVCSCGSPERPPGSCSSARRSEHPRSRGACVAEQIGVERTRFLDFLGDLVDENYFVEEPAVDLRDLIQLIDGGTQVECLLKPPGGGPRSKWLRPQEAFVKPTSDVPGESRYLLVDQPHGLPEYLR